MREIEELAEERSGAEAVEKFNDTIIETAGLMTSVGMSEEEITREYCMEALRALYKGKKNTYIILGIVMVLTFGVMCFASLFFILPVLAMAVFTIVMYTKSRSRLKSAEKLDFYITKDVCIDKGFKIDNEYKDMRGWLKFEQGGKFEIDFSHKDYLIREYAEKMLYDTVKPGDFCYTVHIGREKKISIVLPVKQYRLSNGDFRGENGCYYPIQDKNYGRKVWK